MSRLSPFSYRTRTSPLAVGKVPKDTVTLFVSVTLSAKTVLKYGTAGASCALTRSEPLAPYTTNAQANTAKQLRAARGIALVIIPPLPWCGAFSPPAATQR